MAMAVMQKLKNFNLKILTPITILGLKTMTWQKKNGGKIFANDLKFRRWLFKFVWPRLSPGGRIDLGIKLDCFKRPIFH